jgi:hypothetical protein
VGAVTHGVKHAASHVCLAAIVVGMTVAAAGAARASVESDHSTIYATSAAQPKVNSQGPISQRVAAILRAQGYALIHQLHPWKDDPAALILAGGASNENSIRPNASTAFGLATLYRSTGDRGRLEQMLTLNSTVTVFYADQSWEQTRGVAGKCRVEPGAVVLEDGRRIGIKLDELKVQCP